MALPNEFINDISSLKGLKANKDFTRFRYRFKVEGKEYTTTIDYSSKKAWTPKVRKDNARKEAELYKERKKVETLQPFNPDTKVNFIAKEYFHKKCADTQWTNDRKKLYELYIESFIGNKQISKISEYYVDTIRKNMETTNHHQYKEGGNSIRSIEKVLFQVLKPILEYAKSNGAIQKLPQMTIPNRPKRSQRKRKVKNASEKLVLLYNAINTRYQNDPFYRALFLFAFHGRRWGEIKTLHWESVDFQAGKYTIEAQYNKIGEDQEYFLPADIQIAFEEICLDKTGLVFKSPKTKQIMDSPRRQLSKLKDDTGIQELTMHYFRHLLATALSEYGAAAPVMSAALGHTRSDTVDLYYRSANHLKGSQDAITQLEKIVSIQNR
ncbi:tyrosine-type recombinase/integrase [Sulfurimonas sp.]|uniref:tyrosine-type recombinase/integrase n=1 Tax=Sulfurimonas sp. TaxID=2022749 RepID=UPI0025F06AFE|nr:tyrosine-type recombinase/integrase [Sulfurimonas sp.]MBW6489421.1 tyrosine-type recombinase/integrase [Sulfurimonas sp.]